MDVSPAIQRSITSCVLSTGLVLSFPLLLSLPSPPSPSPAAPFSFGGKRGGGGGGGGGVVVVAVRISGTLGLLPLMAAGEGDDLANCRGSDEAKEKEFEGAGKGYRDRGVGIAAYLQISW